MNKANEIQQELESISTFVAALPRIMPYTIPEDYFNDLKASATILSKKQWGKTMPYDIPQDYFEVFPNRINALMAPELNVIVHQAPYTLPPGYFDTLPQQALNTAQAAESADTQHLPARKYTIRPSLRWAAAALVVLAAGIGGYTSYYRAQQPIEPEKILASVPNSEIQEYVQGTYRLDVNRIVSNNDINEMQLDNSDIITYLNETGWD